MTDTKSRQIDNGRRALVAFGKYAGPAGIVERDGTTRLSFLADPRDMKAITSGTIDGEPYAVLACVPSDHAPKRMVVLTVARDGNPEQTGNGNG